MLLYFPGYCMQNDVACYQWIFAFCNEHASSWQTLGCSRLRDELKTHPPLPKVFGFFSPFSTPIFSLLPTSLLLTSPLLPPSHLPPLSYLPHFILRSFHCQSLKQKPPSLKFGSAWSESHHHQNSRVLETKATIVKA
jgi:hypothetical protein